MRVIGNFPEDPEERSRFLKTVWKIRNSPEIQRMNREADERAAKLRAERRDRKGGR